MSNLMSNRARLTTWRAVTLCSVAAVASIAMTAAPALAEQSHGNGKPQGNWEALAGHHFRNKQQANAEAVLAQHKGFQTVIQTIHSNDIEVEIANGLSSRQAAEHVCARAEAKGLSCETEQEHHGVTKRFGG
jgi:hypothetical protein